MNLEEDVLHTLKKLKGVDFPVKVLNISMTGADKRCSLYIADDWILEGVIWMDLDEKGDWRYKPESVARIAEEQIKRYLKYG